MEPQPPTAPSRPQNSTRRQRHVYRLHFGRRHTALLSIEPYVLELRSAFGTSHSSTTSRQNALISFQLAGGHGTTAVVGHGEVGLPPKKPSVYFANLDDVYRFVAVFAQLWPDPVRRGSSTHWGDAVEDLDRAADVRAAAVSIEQAFGSDAARPSHNRNANPLQTTLSTFALALSALDRHPMHATEPAMSRAAASGVEVAILDAWARTQRQQLHTMLRLPHPSSPTPPPSFCTASLNDDISEMCRQARLARDFSPSLKVKLDADVKKGQRVLKALLTQRIHMETEVGGESGVERWCIDANASWTPAVALQYLAVISDVFRCSVARTADDSATQCPVQLWMIEQPFPADILHARVAGAPAASTGAGASAAGVSGDDDLASNHDAYDTVAWARVREQYSAHNILVYADECVCNASDVPRLRTEDGAWLVDGVNVKMEKAGGPRAMVETARAAAGFGLRVWLGIMVASALNCSTTAQLLGLATECDLDGDLLVSPNSQRFTGGFKWSPGGCIHVITGVSHFGTGTSLKDGNVSTAGTVRDGRDDGNEAGNSSMHDSTVGSADREGSALPRSAKRKRQKAACTHLRTCRRCRIRFSDPNQEPRCRFHAHQIGMPGVFTLVPPHGKFYNADGSVVDAPRGVHFGKWSCCGMADEQHPGCQFGPHISYDDSEELCPSDLTPALA